MFVPKMFRTGCPYTGVPKKVHKQTWYLSRQYVIEKP